MPSLQVLDRRMESQTYGQTKSQTDGQMKSRTDRWNHRRTDGWNHRRTDGITDGRTYGITDRRTDGITDGRTGATLRLYICRHFHGNKVNHIAIEAQSVMVQINFVILATHCNYNWLTYRLTIWQIHWHRTLNLSTLFTTGCGNIR